MQTRFRITRATWDDLPEVASIHVASWQETYVGQVPQSHLDSLDVGERLKRWQEQFSTAGNSQILLARVNDSPGGFICFGPGRDEDRTDAAEIYAVYLLKQYWGCGVGYGLYKAACSHLGEQGFRRVYLWVLDTNRNAISAYERWGGLLERDRIKDHSIGGQPVKEVSVLFNLP